VTRWKNTYPQVLIKIYKVCKFALAELVDFVCNINNVLPTESESHPQNTVLLIALKFRQIIFNVACKQRLNFVFLTRPSSPTLLHPLIRFFFPSPGKDTTDSRLGGSSKDIDRGASHHVEIHQATSRTSVFTTSTKVMRSIDSKSEKKCAVMSEEYRTKMWQFLKKRYVGGKQSVGTGGG
jgi:hypothetical protein